MSNDSEMPIMTLAYAQRKWESRRKLAIFSFCAMIMIFLTLLAVAIFIPNGLEIVEAVNMTVAAIYTSLTAVLLAYFGVDGVERGR